MKEKRPFLEIVRFFRGPQLPFPEAPNPIFIPGQAA